MVVYYHANQLFNSNSATLCRLSYILITVTAHSTTGVGIANSLALLPDTFLNPRTTNRELFTWRLPLASSRCLPELKLVRNIPKRPPRNQHHRRLPKGDDAPVPRQYKRLGHFVCRQVWRESRHPSVHPARGQPAQFWAVHTVWAVAAKIN